MIRAEQPDLFESNYRPSPEAQARAEKVTAAIATSPYDHGLATRLIEYINQAQDVDLWAMRPIAMARRWQVDSPDTIELFLQSVLSGLLESRWDVLCPRCRLSKSATTSIGELPRGVHRDTCNIDFDSDFASNVELSFSPSPSIRAVEYGFFCRSGPGVTPHIKGQCSLNPGTSRSLPLTLHPGDYRIRTLEAGEELELTRDGGAFPEIHVNDNQLSVPGSSPDNEIHLVNDGKIARTIVIEEQSWLRDALTAEHATTMQAFRDPFSEQVLHPGDEVSIRNIAFVFTDLVGSSSLFSRIGDGIHAAFLTPDDALRASIDMQQAMPEFNRRLETEGIATRIGLHSGSSIAVTLNDRLDYHGEAVNLTARLESQGDAGEIVMSKAFTEDPAVDDILSDYEFRKQQLDLKGLNNPVEICLIRPQSENGKSTAPLEAIHY